MNKIKLKNEWEIVDRIGGGGFGKVFRVVSNTKECALKLVPKVPGAERELLFVDLGDAVNVVPILESGEIEGAWAMIMPLAECSLREKLDSEGALPLDEAIIVLSDICTALETISNQVVHRDIKPENILLLDGKWCLADFGIARYAEATTDANTRKYALTPAYSAPERWRFERATSATDIYSVGVVAYELLTGRLPFEGPAFEDFRDQHLHSEAPPVVGVPASIAAIIDECLYKAPGARPSPANLIARFGRATRSVRSKGRMRLVDANLIEIRKRAEEARQQSQQNSEAERRAALLKSAEKSFKEISQFMLDVIAEDASAAEVTRKQDGGWSIRLGQAQMTLSGIYESGSNPWGNWDAPAFDVIAYATLALSIPQDRYGWKGRSHALWFCDAIEAGVYGWFETAFMITPLINRRSTIDPFSLPPSEEAAKALWMGMAEFQVAWPFEILERGNIEEFVERWAGWLADAATGRISHPSTMPERRPDGSWRKK